MARQGLHHVRALLRSALMATGSRMSASATDVGVMYGSAFTMKGMLCMAFMTRGESWLGHDSVLDDWIHIILMGYGKPSSMACSRPSDEACATKSPPSMESAKLLFSFLARHSGGVRCSPEA